jgi:hypothetical protein
VNRPRGLTLTTILMAICNAFGWMVINYSSPHAVSTFIVLIVLIGIGYVVPWAYRQGKNWARIPVLFTSVLTIVNLRSWNSLSPNLLKTPNRVMLASEFVLGAFLLVWLNTARVRAFFRGTGPAGC